MEQSTTDVPCAQPPAAAILVAGGQLSRLPAMTLPFIPGFRASQPRLLGRFLPPLPEGVAAHYIRKHTRPGDLIFDPFGQAPSIAVEALGLDRRLVVASFNPISRLALS